jgi:starvation-inducible outer membrane lipoprotein
MDHVQALYKKKKLLELDWEQAHVEEGLYSLNMVRIDEKIRSIINQIKSAEAEIAYRQIKIETAAPDFSVAS